ncbi:MAG: ComEC/Rec2 family competence protein [Pseudomonadota bacterium]
MRLQRVAATLYTAESGRAMLWVPVGMGMGIALYFSLAAEPPVWTATCVLAPLFLAMTGLARRLGWVGYALTLGALAIATGFALALAHAHAAKAPMLPEMIETGVEGRVVSVGRSASGAPRLLLDQVRLFGVERSETPARIRISLVEQRPDETGILPGQRVRLQARIFPPGGAVEPGAFDFHRSAYFDRIGAVGYAVGPTLRLRAAERVSWVDRASLTLALLRKRIADGLRAQLPGPEGAFAAAIIVGDRSGIEETEEEHLRAANLSHLLAISGLHMGILCGLIFGLVRGGLALIPAIALRYPTKKLAAAAALAMGAAYLALSGATVPTQRAFAMVVVALVAVLLDRPAITLRALALAAVIVLIWRPVSLFDAGFQMSFAATVALVSTFEAVRLDSPGKASHPARRVLLYLAGIAATSLVAGLATGPFAAYHFNRVALWGLPANLLALPIMGLWIAPLAVLSGVLSLFGLAAWAVVPMGEGIGAVLEVAERIAALPGAVQPMQAWPPAALALIALGGLWLSLWRSPIRFAGAVPVAFGLWISADPPPRPNLLIAPGARLVGVLGEDGRAVDHRRAQGFAAQTWLRRDGDAADQETAASRAALSHGRGWARADLAEGWRLEVVQGRKPDRAALAELCIPKTILIARHGPPLAGACCYLGEAHLRDLGAAALRIAEGRVEIEGARSGGKRLWDQHAAGRPINRCE